MKLCSACLDELPKEKFSKKQWQLKQQRRCKECIDANREVRLNLPSKGNEPSREQRPKSAKKAVEKKELRFKVGDRVECRMHAQSNDELAIDALCDLSFEDILSQLSVESGPFSMTWKQGTVVKLWHKEGGVCHPYQVCLEDCTAIYVPHDTDEYIRKPALPPTVEAPIDINDPLFKQPARTEECIICCLPLPLQSTLHKYQTCCGKVLCLGCIHAAWMADNRKLCPFCRILGTTSDEEQLERFKKRAERGDACAIYNMGGMYYRGDMGLPQDYGKAVELALQAGDLGHSASYRNVGSAYYMGEGVERDLKKAKHYWELAAMGGNVDARHKLGFLECNAGNMKKAVMHYMISAGAGYDLSLEVIRELFSDGHATKDDYETALRAHKEANDEMKSDQRDAAVVYYGKDV